MHLGSDGVAIAPGNYHTSNYNGVILAPPSRMRKGEPRKSGVSLCAPSGWGTLADAMPAHLRPRESRARPLGVLALALGVAALVGVAVGRDRGRDTATLVQPAADVATDPTVLGEALEPSTDPTAPPASAATVTTAAPPPEPTTSAPSRPPRRPRLAPPVSVTAPPTTRPTTTTTTTTVPATTTTTEPPPTTTTTTVEPTTTTTDGTTTTTTDPTPP